MRWLLLLLAAASCGRRAERNDKAGDEKPAMRNVELPEPAIALPRELSFEVLDAGSAEQRAPLHYTFDGSTAQLTSVTQLSSRTLDEGTWRDAGTLPSITTDVELAATADGKLTIRPVAGGAPAELALDTRGRLRDHGTTSSADELVQRLLVAIVPFPDEPVGIGARWRAATALRQQGAVLEETATYTLLAREPLRVGVEIQQLAEAQKIGDVELVAIVRKLAGTYELTRARPVPVHGSLEGTSSVHMRDGTGEHIAEDTMKIELISSTR